MTKEEFLKLKCGDKVYDTDFNEFGIIEVCSVGDVCVKFYKNPDNIGLYEYDISFDPNCFESLKKI